METARQIISELAALRKDVQYIKTHIRDVDTVLTDDDIKSIEQAREDQRTGKTKRL